MKYTITLIDIDPDNGEISQQLTIAVVYNLQTAQLFRDYIAKLDEEPNREYKIIENES